MPFVRSLSVAFSIFFAAAVFAGDVSTNPVGSQGKIDQLLDAAMTHGLIAGGVVLVGNHRGVLFERAYGKVSGAVDARPMTLDTVFDIASLTKVVATAPSVLKLAEDGKLSLVDPVSRWFPEFDRHGKNDLLLMNLLTHTSGLDDFPLSSVNPVQSAVEGAAGQKSKGTVGSRFKYADINFILLAETVRKVSGVGLDAFAMDSIFAPLGMKDTTFNPGGDRLSRCSATLSSDNSLLVGQVQDYVARQFGGVAGHAGLFSTADDLARFCRMILNGGEYEGRRILSERAVNQMTAPYFSRGGKVVRGLGWDIDSPYSSPRGSGFSEVSFGHTGYSGSSIWIDPASDTFVVLLTSRLEFRKTREFSRLRSDLSSIAAVQFAPSTRVGALTRLNYE